MFFQQATIIASYSAPQLGQMAVPQKRDQQQVLQVHV